MDTVYVLTYGQAYYEDEPYIVGVFSSRQNALNKVGTGRASYETAVWGQDYYRIEEYKLNLV